MNKKLTLTLLMCSALMSSSALAAERLSVRAVTPNQAGVLEKLYIINGDSASGEGVTIEMEDVSSKIKTGETKTIRLLHINDLHSHLVDFHRKGDTHRLAQISKIVKEARAAATQAGEAVLFLSVGDEHIGTVWDELLGANADDFQMSAPYRALSAAGLDMSVVGNHELDKGSELLARAIDQDATFPVLTANLVGSKFQMPWARAAIGEVQGVRIGFIGLTSTVDTYLQTEADPGLKGYDPVAVTKNMVAALSPKVDMIVLLSHVGYNGIALKGQELKYDLAVGDKQIAEAASKASTKPVVLLGGHTHTVLNEAGLQDHSFVSGVPILQAGEYGKFVGDLTVRLHREQNGGLKADYTARLIPTKGRDQESTADLDLDLQQKVLDPIKVQLDKRLQEAVGVVVPNEGLKDATVVSERYIGESAMANFMNDAIVQRSQHWPQGPVDFAAFNATGMRGVDMKDALTYDEWYKVMPYADEIFVYSLSGSQLKDIIEDNAQRIVRPEELVVNGGALDPQKFIPRGFQHYSSGVRYEIILGDTPLET
ncbi:MAG: bifunctional UDP-sugar hydrolase/5'-nucleotidase, partial [Sneathiella sp.]